MSSVLDLLALLEVMARRHRKAFAWHGPSSRVELVAEEEVSRRRSLACPEYDRCLDIAFRQRWRSWTCERCSLFPLAAGFRSRELTRVGGERPLAGEA